MKRWKGRKNQNMESRENFPSANLVKNKTPPVISVRVLNEKYAEIFTCMAWK